MFLIRASFWLFLIVMMIPTGDTGENATQAGEDVSPLEAFSAAQHTVSDLAGFCERNPDTCETGTAVFKTFGQKAQHGAKMLYEYLSETDFGGSSSAPGTDTLRGEDRDVPWQGPDAQG